MQYKSPISSREEVMAKVKVSVYAHTQTPGYDIMPKKKYVSLLSHAEKK